MHGSLKDTSINTRHGSPGRVKRLLSIGHSYVLGVNRRLTHELQRQSGGKWEVSVVAPEYFCGKDDIRANKFAMEPDEPVPVFPIKAHYTRNIHLFYYERKLSKILGQEFDLIHAWEEPYILAGFQIARSVPKNVPLVFRSAQSLPKRYPPPFSWMESYCTKRMSGWIFSGSLVEQNLLQRPGYSDKPRCQAPLGIDPDKMFVNRLAGDSVKRSLGWDDSIPVVGYIGRFVEAKGLHVIMRAFDEIKTPCRLLLVGNGPMLGEIERWSKKHSNAVQICTEVLHSDVAGYVNAMQTLLVPSLTTANWKEQFGRAIVEAFACGVPVIGSDSGEIPYVIADAGIVVPENQPVLLANAIEQLLESPKQRQEFIARGLQLVREKYTWGCIARQMLRFFDEVVERGVGGR